MTGTLRHRIGLFDYDGELSRLCLRCSEPKELGAFSKDKRFMDGRGDVCKECKAAAQRERKRVGVRVVRIGGPGWSWMSHAQRRRVREGMKRGWVMLGVLPWGEVVRVGRWKMRWKSLENAKKGLMSDDTY